MQTQMKLISVTTSLQLCDAGVKWLSWLPNPKHAHALLLHPFFTYSFSFSFLKKEQLPLSQHRFI